MSKKTTTLLIILLGLGIALTIALFVAFNTKDENDVPVIVNITNQIFNNNEIDNDSNQDTIKEETEEDDTTFIAFSEDDKKNTSTNTNTNTNTNTSSNTNKNTNNSSSANQNTNNTVTGETNEEGTELIEGLVNNGDGSYSLPEIPLE